MVRNYEVMNFIQKGVFVLRRSRVASFSDIIKIATMFINENNL